VYIHWRYSYLLLPRHPSAHNLFNALAITTTTAAPVVAELVETYAAFAKAVATSSSARYQQKQLDFKDPTTREQAVALKKMVHEARVAEKTAQQHLWMLARQLPNTTHPAVPVGGETHARVLRVCGEPRRFDFPHKDHVALATRLQILDFPAAARASGEGFYYLLGAGALLELALVQFAMARLVGAGFKPVLTPDVARESTVDNCGFQPRGEATQVYRLDPSHGSGLGDLCLVGTAEIPLAALNAGTVVPEQTLPLRYAAFGHCFRAETSAGAKSRGLYRVHQFSKVELFCVTTEADSDAQLEALVATQAGLCDELGLHYRVLDMPTLELGAPAHRKYDIEAWMPGRGEFGEICSASNCTDFQSRRFDMRYRSQPDGKVQPCPPL
jgi:seryl-tRNA synthetase